MRVLLSYNETPICLGLGFQGFVEFFTAVQQPVLINWLVPMQLACCGTSILLISVLR